jgi:hypothetical protein
LSAGECRTPLEWKSSRHRKRSVSSLPQPAARRVPVSTIRLAEFPFKIALLTGGDRVLDAVLSPVLIDLVTRRKWVLDYSVLPHP